jgi:hypothetical protein
MGHVLFERDLRLNASMRNVPHAPGDGRVLRLETIDDPHRTYRRARLSQS